MKELQIDDSDQVLGMMFWHSKVSENSDINLNVSGIKP